MGVTVGGVELIECTMGKLNTLRPRLQELQQTLRQPQKQADPFYLSPAWREARAMCLIRFGNQCIKCGRSNTRLFVDHIVELKDGGDPLSQDNLEPLCGSCHTTKTAQVRQARSAR